MSDGGLNWYIAVVARALYREHRLVYDRSSASWLGAKQGLINWLCHNLTMTRGPWCYSRIRNRLQFWLSMILFWTHTFCNPNLLRLGELLTLAVIISCGCTWAGDFCLRIWSNRRFSAWFLAQHVINPNFRLRMKMGAAEHSIRPFRFTPDTILGTTTVQYM
jgi:hypothetical protein